MEKVSAEKILPASSLVSEDVKIVSLKDRVFIKYKDKKKNLSIEVMGSTPPIVKLSCQDVDSNMLFNNKEHCESLACNLTELSNDKQKLSGSQPGKLIGMDVFSSLKFKQFFKRGDIGNPADPLHSIKEMNVSRLEKSFNFCKTTTTDAGIKSLETFQREVTSGQSPRLNNNHFKPAAEHSHEIKENNKSHNDFKPAAEHSHEIKENNKSHNDFKPAAEHSHEIKKNNKSHNDFNPSAEHSHEINKNNKSNNDFKPAAEPSHEIKKNNKIDNDFIPISERSYDMKKDNKSNNNVIPNIIFPHSMNERALVAKVIEKKQATSPTPLLPEAKMMIDSTVKSSEPITYSFQRIPGEHSVKILPLTQVQLSLKPSSILVQNLLQQKKGSYDTSAEWLLSIDSILEDENESDYQQ
ncbi:hypothetical protein ITX54_13680 [Rouxiella silvae]|uniref:Surface presentation of antigen domain-containing protein n=1 Tax=Rouxiella silvae TaxID=1646373 RepID=A0AA41BX13_9GAMM|nr:hypothetical protein [Rouxiella silvae]MBF6637710.1 hypothetical protein [Rouxiella silvae]